MLVSLFDATLQVELFAKFIMLLSGCCTSVAGAGRRDLVVLVFDGFPEFVVVDCVKSFFEVYGCSL